MSVTAAALRELHRIHQQLADLRDRQARGPKQIRARETAVARLEQEAAGVRGETKNARVTADQKQLLLKSGEVKIEDLRRKLNACSSNREYQALLEQIAADEMANSTFADEILEALEKVDEFQGRIAEAEQNLLKGKQELAKAQATVAEQQGLIEGDLRRLEAELTEAERALPPDLCDAYQRVMKSKGSDGMAAVDADSCGGCFQNLTANNHNALKLGRVVFCQSCGRLLYLPEERILGG